MSAGRISVRRLALWAVLAAVVTGLPWIFRNSPAPLPGLEPSIEGGFQEGGAIPLDSVYGAPGMRGDPGGVLSPGPTWPFWSSWSGTFESTGQLRFGPFSAPACVSVEVCGYPTAAGNALFLLNPGSGERLPLIRINPGPHWVEVRSDVPAAWRGQRIELVAEDHSHTPYGWLAVAAPRSVPAWAGLWTGNVSTLATFAQVGLLFALFQMAAFQLVRFRPEIPGPLKPAAATAVWLLAGYSLFWVFMASAAAGTAAAGLLIAAAWVLASRTDPPATRRVLILPCLYAGIGLVYLGLLLGFEPGRPLVDEAARRFSQDLAGDNQLPGEFARLLAAGLPNRVLTYGIRASERPPLQAGAALLLILPSRLGGSDFGTASQCAGFFAQLVWIGAAWGWLRTRSLGERGAATIIAAVAASGFLLVNTTFVWPKLLSAGLALTGFLFLLDEPEDGPHTPRRILLGAFLLALALLSHPACAFALCGAVPFVARRLARHPGASLIGALAAGALLAPWALYQHGDPASSRLFKWVISGDNAMDGRGALEALVHAYRATPIRTLLAARMQDLRVIVGGPWRAWLVVGTLPQADRRAAEYFSTFFALGWWNLGLLAALWGAWRHRAGPLLRTSLGWCAATLVLWLTLMFQPGATMIHAGPYAIELLLFLAAASSLWDVSPYFFATVALLQALEFAIVWAPPTPAANGPFDPLAGALLGLGILAIAAGLVLAAKKTPGVSAGHSNDG